MLSVFRETVLSAKADASNRKYYLTPGQSHLLSRGIGPMNSYTSMIPQKSPDPVAERAMKRREKPHKIACKVQQRRLSSWVMASKLQSARRRLLRP
jgi:hypothetical protein